MSAVTTWGLGVVVAFLFGGCEEPIACPATWSDAPANEDGTCDPPDHVRTAVEERLETGIYGYAIACVDDGRDDCGCEDDGLYEGGGTFLLRDDRLDDGDQSVLVTIRPDATFEAQASPNVDYFLHGEELDVAYASGIAGEAVGPIIVLERGQVVHLVVRVRLSC